jgi:hypothetical protein
MTLLIFPLSAARYPLSAQSAIRHVLADSG